VSTEPSPSKTGDDAAETSPCTACRGIGTVVSNLGGEPSTVSCPWCDGTGVFIKDHDAQLHWGDDPPRGRTAEEAEAEAEAKA
jgi:hypothetical protein